MRESLRSVRLVELEHRMRELFKAYSSEIAAWMTERTAEGMRRIAESKAGKK